MPRTPSEHGLGRVQPLDFSHVDKYPFKTVAPSTVMNVERVLGLPWWHWSHDQGREGSCLPPDARVLMADGSVRPISELRLLDEVVTAEGRTGRVLETTTRLHTDGLVNVRLWGHSHLRLTANHPVLTKRGYVAAGELRPGEDEVRLPGFLSEREHAIEVGAFVAQRERGRVGATHTGSVTTVVKALPEVVALTPEFGRLLGLYAAEGSTTANRVVWTFGAHEEELIAECSALLRDVLGVEPRVQLRPNNSVNVVAYGKGVRLLFERLMGTGSAAKRVHGKLASGPRNFIEAMFWGWMDGDGHQRKRNNEFNGVTVSRDLAMTMYGFAQALGLRPTITRNQPKVSHGVKVRREVWNLRFHLPVREAMNYRCSVDAGGAWRRVKGIEVEEWAGYVYNCHVEGDESYVAEGVGVHNCVGHGCAMERAITNSTQNKVLLALRFYTRRYDPLDIWNEAKLVDEFPETQPGDDNGTTVRAGYDILRDRGPRRIALNGIKLNDSGDPVVDEQHERAPDIGEGVIRTRWATTVDEIRTAIADGIPVVIGVDWFSNFDDPLPFGTDKWIGRAGWQNTTLRGGHCVCLYGASDKRQAVKLKNSWGRSYPLVWLTYQALGGLLGRNGEAALTTDR
jgi:hypothetical protein